VAVTLLVIVGLALVLAVVVTGGTPSTTTTYATPPVSAVPTFKGLTLTNARSLARLRDGRVYVALRVPSRATAGTVVAQSPNPSWPVGLVVSSGPWSHDDAVLPGERTPPVRHECAQAVWLSEDGNAYPLLCSGHRVNVGAWLFYAKGHPSMMSLARTTSLSRVVASLCHFKVDEPQGFNDSEETLPEQENVFILAAAYNGWSVPKGLNCSHYVATS
jgi:hypothetical protein